MISIADGFTLPDAIVTDTLAFLAKRGTGKSNAAVVLAEQMWDAGFQWVAIDPKGDWWGIRSSADGKTDGLPVLLVGGRHGDLPLDASNGALMASLVIEQNLTLVLDVSLFSKGDQIRFVTDFAETLFRQISGDPRPLHLFLEEAEEFLPQRVNGTTARMVGAYSKIAKQGRAFGLGVSLITQRSASLNKDALSQTDTLVLFRTPSPHDQKAVIAWAEQSPEVKDIARSLSSLEPGESWILSPGFLGSTTKVRWHRRRTFDSGATPLTGGKRPEPKSLAQVDLGAIKELMAETVEKAEAVDPKRLQAQIRELQSALAEVEDEKDRMYLELQGLREAPVPEPEQVVVKVIPPDAMSAARVMLDHAERMYEGARSFLSACEAVERRGGDGADGHPPTVPKDTPERQPVGVPAPSPRRRTPPAPPIGADAPPGKLQSRERKILTVLAQYPDGMNQHRLAVLTGYSPRASTVGAGLSALRKQGHVNSGQPIQITSEGLAALGPYEPLPTGPALLAYWLENAGGERERRFLQIVVDAYPEPTNADVISEQTGYSKEASTIGAGMSRLRKLGLVDGWRAHPDFMDAIRGKS